MPSADREIRLGRTGTRVHPVGLGTWGFGGPVFVGGQAEGWGGADDGDARRALLAAHELGIRHWDTADAYGAGRAETLIGSVWSQVPRDEIFLTSKVGHAPLLARHAYEPRHLRLQVEASLRRLRTDHLDACYLHHCDFGPDDRWLPEAAAAMRTLVDAGHVRHVGLSDWDLAAVARCVPALDPDLVQVPRNVAEDGYRGSHLERLAHERDVGVVFFSPLKHGLLTGRWRQPPAFEEGDLRGRLACFDDAALLARIAALAQQIEERLPEHPQPMLQAAIAPLLDAPRNAVLIGLRRPQHVRAAATLGAPLDPQLASWLTDRFGALLTASA